MKTNIILLLALLYITLQQTTLLASNTNNVISTSLPLSNIIIESFHNTNNSGVIGYGAKWIWIPGSSWPDGFKADFQAQFYANCQSPVILYITADNIFSASINSGPAVTGSDWTKPFAFKISNINCGINTININVTNRDIGSQAGLIFAIVQDQSSCFSCQSPLSFYNQNTCQCECISTCTNCSGLNSNYVWNNYPTCGCKCPPQVGRCSLGTYFN